MLRNTDSMILFSVLSVLAFPKAGIGAEKVGEAKPASAAAKRAADGADSEVRLFDDFDGGLTLPWEPVRPDPTHVSFTKHPSTLTIVTQAGCILRSEKSRLAAGGVQAKNIYLVRNPFVHGGDFVVLTCLASFSPKVPWQQAGLIVYDDDDNYLKWETEANARSKTGAAMVCVHETQGEPHSALFEAKGGQERVWLKLIKRGNCYQHACSLDGKEYLVLGEEVWGNGKPQRVGLLAKNGPVAAETEARFEFFEIRTLSPMEATHAGERQRLQGIWEMIADRPNGRAEAEGTVSRFAFSDRTVVVRENARTFTAQYTLDAAKSPKELILSMPGNWQNKRLLRIAYARDGDRLTICFDPRPDAAAPRTLEAKEGDGRILTTLRRVNAGQ
jgi:uncharacterized protein (TIGR03067 family)